jgi:hemerythrin-like metal-binding protein
LGKLDFIVWQPEYSIGVVEIDYQHKELLNLVNYTINNCTGNKIEEKKYFNKIIDGTIKQMKEHFSTEERIMEKTNYPKYNDHKSEHEKVIKELSEIVEGIKDGTIELKLIEIASFLKDWILDHIPRYDKDAKEYFLKGYDNK